MRRKNLFCLSLFVGLFVLLICNPLGYAKVTAQPDFQGTLLVTAPDGKIDMFDEGEAVSPIVSNSAIEVFGGNFTVTTEAGDSVTCACLNHKMTVSGGASAKLACEEESGILKVLKGSVLLTDAQGKEHTIPEGREYPIKPGSATEAPPTAEGAGPGTPVPADLPPPDSRSIEASPSR